MITNDVELRRIDPGDAPGASHDNAVEVRLEEAWERVSESIIRQHNELTQPQAEEESIGPTQRFALEILRDPTVRLPPGAVEAEQALSVQRGTNVRRDLGQVRRLLRDGEITRDEAASRVVRVVTDYGLQPVEAPPALEPIDEDNIGVVCWMAVLPTAEA